MTRGRKSIDSDIDALVFMALLKRAADRSGRNFSIRRAADEARDKLSVVGTMPESVSDRLRTKFAQHCRDENSLVARIISQDASATLGHLPHEQQEPSMSASIATIETSVVTPLVDVPGYVAARAKLSKVRADIDGRTTRLKALRKIVNGLNSDRETEIERGTDAYLETGNLIKRASYEEEIAQIEHDLDILSAAYYAQAQVVETEKSVAHEQAAELARATHKALVSDVFEAAVALADAIQREQDFLDHLRRNGYHFAHMNDVSDTLASSFGARRRWDSRFQNFAIRAAQYLGRAWKRG